MRVLVAVWRLVVLVLLLVIVAQLARIDRALYTPPAPSSSPAAAVRAPSAGKSRAQVEWERESDERARRAAAIILGPDEGKKVMDEVGAASKSQPAPK